MKILIITQSVDLNDPVLGFFRRWIIEFSKYFEKVTVICLGKGETKLPDKVKVLSLGKESGSSKFKYLRRFYFYIWQTRHDYDMVFVHMNQEYVILAGLWWRLMGKKILMWRNHVKGNWLTNVAVLLAHKVFCTSASSYTAKFSKTSIMPVGIDTDLFKKLPNIEKENNSILFIGRVAPVKKIEILFDAMITLKKQGIQPKLHVYGQALPRDVEYEKEIKSIAEKDLAGQVVFYGNVKNDETPKLYNRYSVFVNLTPRGSFDKTIIESMSCEMPTISCNNSLRGAVPTELIFREGDVQDLSAKLQSVLAMSDSERESLGHKLRQYVESNHSLALLASKLFGRE